MRLFFTRLILLSFIILILLWLIPSNIDFYLLRGANGGLLPDWLKNMSPVLRLIFVNLTNQLFYWLIIIGFIIEFFRPRLNLRWKKNWLLTTLAMIMFIDAIYTFVYFGFLKHFDFGFYDTMFYGPIFGLLFLLDIDPESLGIKVVFWTRIVEVFGFFLGYLYLPPLFGIWSGGGQEFTSANGLLSSPNFWTDLIVQLASVIGIIYILLQTNKNRFFKLIGVSVGSFIIGAFIGFLLNH